MHFADGITISPCFLFGDSFPRRHLGQKGLRGKVNISWSVRSGLRGSFEWGEKYPWVVRVITPVKPQLYVTIFIGDMSFWPNKFYEKKTPIFFGGMSLHGLGVMKNHPQAFIKYMTYPYVHPTDPSQTISSEGVSIYLSTQAQP